MSATLSPAPTPHGPLTDLDAPCRWALRQAVQDPGEAASLSKWSVWKGHGKCTCPFDGWIDQVSVGKGQPGSWRARVPLICLPLLCRSSHLCSPGMLRTTLKVSGGRAQSWLSPHTPPHRRRQAPAATWSEGACGAMVRKVVTPSFPSYEQSKPLGEDWLVRRAGGPAKGVCLPPPPPWDLN